MRTRLLVCAVCAWLAAGLLSGCGSGAGQPDFPDLHPAKGVIKRDGQPVKGGSVRFTPDPDKPDFVVNAEVGADGTYALTTVRTTDSRGERKTGAPVGTYKVTYTPPLGDQTAGAQSAPATLSKPVSVSAGNNDIPVELPKK